LVLSFRLGTKNNLQRELPIVTRTHSALCGLLLAVAGSSALAQQMAFISIDPNDFPSTQNIWNSTFGAQIRELTAAPNPNSDPNNPNTWYVPVYYKVAYSAPVDPNCRALDPNVPCAADGNALLSFMPFTTPITEWWTPGAIWGAAYSALQCVSGTCNPSDGLNITYYPALRIDFTVPTDRVTVDSVYALGMRGAFYALDKNGNVVGSCDPNAYPTDPCATSFITGIGSFNGWDHLTITRPTADISFIVFGGPLSDPRSTSRISFDSPIPLQFDGLVVKAASVGPVAALTVLLAQVYYGAHDTHASCTFLKGFVSLVNAESGKKITAYTASQLNSTAIALEAGIGCH
jgi:hypothetical protein